MELEDDKEFDNQAEYAVAVHYRYFTPAFDGLAVRNTTLPGCQFSGLFAGMNFDEGSVICKYTGTFLSTKEALRLEDKSYLMRLGEQCYIDAKDTMNVFAR